MKKLILFTLLINISFLGNSTSPKIGYFHLLELKNAQKHYLLFVERLMIKGAQQSISKKKPNERHLVARKISNIGAIKWFETFDATQCENEYEISVYNATKQALNQSLVDLNKEIDISEEEFQAFTSEIWDE